MVVSTIERRNGMKARAPQREIYLDNQIRILKGIMILSRSAEVMQNNE